MSNLFLKQVSKTQIAKKAENLLICILMLFFLILAAIFPLIVLLFAGGWSDRYNKRKACMIAPIIGEALSFTCEFNLNFLKYLLTITNHIHRSFNIRIVFRLTAHGIRSIL